MSERDTKLIMRSVIQPRSCGTVRLIGAIAFQKRELRSTSSRGSRTHTHTHAAIATTSARVSA